MERESAFFVGACGMAIGVALGAFGAHSLKSKGTEKNLLDVWATSTNYCYISNLGLLLTSVAPIFSKNAANLLLIGEILFSGSLFALVLTGKKKIGIITPFGGAAMILGWMFLAAAHYGVTFK